MNTKQQKGPDYFKQLLEQANARPAPEPAAIPVPLSPIACANDASATEQPDAPNVASQLRAVQQECAQNDLQAAIEAENRKFFVASENGRPGIFHEGIDAELGHHTITAITQAEYKLARANRTVQVVDGKGNTRIVPIADAWLRSPARREYPNGLALLPGQDAPEGVFNLWRGFDIEPAEGDFKPELKHLCDVICGGDRTALKYLLCWMARCVQTPGEPAEVAVVLRGGRGTGKSTVGRWMTRIFGPHGLHILNSRHLVGNFNNHLRSACFLFADEAFFAGDRQGADVLKGLVTEPTITIERKGVDAFTARNRLKIMMASNSDWVVPAGTDERRFLVLDVSNCHKQDLTYFAKLNAHAENGGLSALLHYLLHLDIHAFNVRAVPNTAGLVNQKLLSLQPVLAWVYERLYVGHILEDETGWVAEQRRETIVSEFLNYVHRNGKQHVDTSASAVGRALHVVFPNLRAKRGAKGTNGKRPWVWVFPDLDQARGQFEAAVLAGGCAPWPEDAE